MTVQWKPPVLVLLALAGFMGTVAPPRAAAQTWANNAYRYRAPLTITNPSGASLGVGDVVAFSFHPNYGVFEGKSRADSKDLRIYYWDGSSNQDVGQVMLDMSKVTGKILFQLGAPIAPGNPLPFARGTDASTFNIAPAGETSLNMQADDAVKVVPLGITFPFLGGSYTQAVVSTNGWIAFDTGITEPRYGAFAVETDPDPEDTESTMLGRKFIAPFSGDWDTSVPGGGVYKSTAADSVTFRWAAAKYDSAGGTKAVTMNFSVTLFTDGRIRFNYGPQAATQVTNETHTTADGSFTLNNKPGIIGGSEVLQDVTGTVTYTRGVEYVINNNTGVVSVDTTAIPNGTDVRISYKYASGVTCAAPDNHLSPAFANAGIALGDSLADMLERVPTPKDLGGQPSVVFTPQVTTVTSITPSATTPGYYVYYGNPADTGSRTAIPTSKLVSYTFDTGSDQGWVALGTATVSAVTTPAGRWFRGEKSLRVRPSDSSERPMAFAQSQPTSFADVTLYAKARATVPPTSDTGGGEVAVMVRADANGNGYGLYTSGLSVPPSASQPSSPQAGLMVRSSVPEKDYRPVSASSADNSQTWSLFILEASGSGTVRLRGKVYERSQLEPKGYEYDATLPNALPAGAIGVTGFGNGGSTADDIYLDWAYAAGNANADSFPAAIGAEEVMPLPAGYGLVQGVTSDAGISASLGYAVPLPGATVTLTPTAGGSSVTFPTSIYGAFALYLPAGTYTAQFSASGYTTATETIVVTDGATTTADKALNAPNLVHNPGFETADPAAPGVKPRGWYRRTYSDNLTGFPNPTGVTPPWGYWKTGGANAHSGNSSIYIAGTYFDDPNNPGTTTNIIASWQVEGSVSPVIYTDASGFDHEEYDGRGNGPAPPVITGEYYRISAWVKKDSDTGEARLRIRDLARDDDGEASRIDGGTNGITATQITNTGGTWKQLSVIYRAASNYLSVRLYGVDTPTSSPVYWDDVEVARVSQPVFHGTVKTSAGVGVGNAAVGIHEAYATPALGYANGLSDPVNYTTTDALGRWQIAFVPKPGVSYVAQAWVDSSLNRIDVGYKASDNVAVQPLGTKTEIVYDPKLLANLASGRNIVSYSSMQSTTQRPEHLTDGSYTVWRSNPNSGVSRAYPNPQYAIIDLGQTINWADVEQVSIIFRQEVPAHWMLRASNTAPSATLTTTAAKTYGTLIYDSPNAADSVAPIQDSAGYRTHQTVVDEGGNYAIENKIVTKDAFRNKPAAVRYVNFVMDQFYAPYTAVQIWEIRVEVPGGTVIGKVVDKNLTPVAGARIGRFPDGPDYVITNGQGEYTLYNCPTVGAFTVQAHLPTTDANQVYAVTPSTPVAVVANGTVTAPTIGIGAPAPDIASSASQTRPELDVAETPASNAADKTFATMFQTAPFGDIAPAPLLNKNNPLDLIIDLGGSKTFNTVIVNWTSLYSPTYAIQTSTDGTNWTTQYSTTNSTTGYGVTNVDGVNYRGIDPLTLPSPVTASKVRIHMEARAPGADTVAIWEVQVANAEQFTPPTTLAGDVNKSGAVDAADVVAGLKVIGGLTSGSDTDISFVNLDVNADSLATLIDALRISRYVSGISATP